MKKYRRKTVVIEAYQFNRKMVEDNIFDKVPLPNGIRITSSSSHPPSRTLSSYTVRIDTLEGETYLVSEGDWIIKGVRGEFYPCKPDIFEQTYEKVEGEL